MLASRDAIRDENTGWPGVRPGDGQNRHRVVTGGDARDADPDLAPMPFPGPKDLSYLEALRNWIFSPPPANKWIALWGRQLPCENACLVPDRCAGAVELPAELSLLGDADVHNCMTCERVFVLVREKKSAS